MKLFEDTILTRLKELEVENEELKKELQRYQDIEGTPLDFEFEFGEGPDLEDESDSLGEIQQTFLSEFKGRKVRELEKKEQLELVDYKKMWQTKEGIGKWYERQIGQRYEEKGYKVTYKGIKEGLKDFGIDLIAEKNEDVLIIQCKCWGKARVIREKYLLNIFGATCYHSRINKEKRKIRAVFVTTTDLSMEAVQAAKRLGVELRQVELNKEIPLIKCNIGKSKERIYHLPWDQQYDNIVIGDVSGEFFAATIDEAVRSGFRRCKNKGAFPSKAINKKKRDSKKGKRSRKNNPKNRAA